MARAYSQDLRDRLIDEALAGLPARQAAAQFRIGLATAIGWVRQVRETGNRRPSRQGKPRRSKLDEHRDYILGLIEAKPDMKFSICSLRHDEVPLSHTPLIPSRRCRPGGVDHASVQRHPWHSPDFLRSPRHCRCPRRRYVPPRPGYEHPRTPERILRYPGSAPAHSTWRMNRLPRRSGFGCSAASASVFGRGGLRFLCFRAGVRFRHAVEIRVTVGTSERIPVPRGGRSATLGFRGRGP